ncbi:MAG: phenylalanine--tRNA ligase subunit alpha [Thermoplasmatota archaeon]
MVPVPLSQASRRLVQALKKPTDAAQSQELGFATEAELLLAAQKPEREGLLEIRARTLTRHELTSEGRRIAGSLPETRALKALQAGPLPPAELARKADLTGAEARIIVGLLKRRGWATISEGQIRPLAAPPAQDLRSDLLATLAAGPTTLAASAELSELVERQLVRAFTVTLRTLVPTAKGAAFDSGAADVVEVNQITPELVARWPTLSPEERSRHVLRAFDFSAPVTPLYPGKPHPLEQMMAEIRALFWKMGFQEIQGDYVESAYWNMDALFIPQDHPARDMQDTFYLREPARQEVPPKDLERAAAVHENGGKTGSTGWGGTFDRDVAQRALLRTHTTNTTIRYLATAFQNEGAASAHRVFGLGRVFRKETMDATHLPEFTQIEGIVTEPGASFNTLIGLARAFFAGMGFPQVRFRPAYFPYTEPSMEIEVHYNGRWMELGGCGLFRPEVTAPLGVPHNVLAWGFGLERLAMMRLGLKDIRALYVSDVQWLREAPLGHGAR